mmetsp:Transcript_65477/g.156437  ORF Transcript_65477/g.156437 Transcript_65477/m.156437 type:complete len:220 (-) Transcript_65477:26-685(-)
MHGAVAGCRMPPAVLLPASGRRRRSLSYPRRARYPILGQGNGDRIHCHPAPSGHSCGTQPLLSAGRAPLPMSTGAQRTLLPLRAACPARAPSGGRALGAAPPGCARNGTQDWYTSPSPSTTCRASCRQGQASSATPAGRGQSGRPRPWHRRPRCGTCTSSSSQRPASARSAPHPHWPWSRGSPGAPQASWRGGSCACEASRAKQRTAEFVGEQRHQPPS